MNAAIPGGVGKPTPFNFKLIPAHKPEQLLNNVRYAMTLGLPEIKQCAPHDQILSIAGGGPSLEDTWQELTGYVATANGSLSYLLGKGVIPHMCGICDPSAHMADIIEAKEGVTYFVASCVHPSVFQKLLTAKCNVHLWHLHPIDGLDELLTQYYPDGWLQIPGGCTMGTRWLTLGYHLGFRKFHCHGLDSSFRGKSSHAYPDHQDAKEWVNFDGYPTRINFIGQVVDFIGLMEDSRIPEVEPIEVKMFGDGLLQHRYAQWLAKNPPYVWPSNDEKGQILTLIESKNIPKFLEFIPKRGTCIQAGGNVGVFPRILANHFETVITFEPNTENYNCLLENTRHYPNIKKHRAALGLYRKHVGTSCHQPGHCGATHVTTGKEATMVALDSMAIEDCDLFWLDVEGYEELALQGAAKTIEKFKPAVIIEEKLELQELHGLEPTGAIKWLKGKGYHRVVKYNNDCLYVYGGE